MAATIYEPLSTAHLKSCTVDFDSRPDKKAVNLVQYDQTIPILCVSLNANARAILDAMTAQRIEAKDAKIAEQNQQIFAAQLAASQAAQNSYLLNQLRPLPVPAYQSCNPWAAGTYNGCNGCGC